MTGELKAIKHLHHPHPHPHPHLLPQPKRHGGGGVSVGGEFAVRQAMGTEGGRVALNL